MSKKGAVMLLLALTMLLAVVPGSGATTTEPEPAEAPEAIGSFVHATNHGTAWVAERKWKFSTFAPIAWGMRSSAKAATTEWVHIPIPIPTYIDGTQLKVNYVQFCARSTNPTQTKPITIDLFADNVRVHSSAITWPDKVTKHCHGISFPARWMETLGLSVRVAYADASDWVVFHKAWAQLVP